MDILTHSALIDEILGPHEKGLGTGYLGYRNHCFRMLNVGRFLVLSLVLPVLQSRLRQSR